MPPREFSEKKSSGRSTRMLEDAILMAQEQNRTIGIVGASLEHARQLMATLIQIGSKYVREVEWDCAVRVASPKFHSTTTIRFFSIEKFPPCNIYNPVIPGVEIVLIDHIVLENKINMMWALWEESCYMPKKTAGLVADESKIPLDPITAAVDYMNSVPRSAPPPVRLPGADV